MAKSPIKSNSLPVAPSIPLTPELRTAYKDLYDELETQIQATRDPGEHGALLDSQSNVENVLDKDDLYRLQANTALYQALAAQITDTTANLQALQTQIQAISSGVSRFANVLSAVSKVLSLVGGA